jgi:peptide/nickel transport system permease protein
MSADPLAELAFPEGPTSGRARVPGASRSTAVRHVLGALATLLVISLITFFGTSLKSPEELAKASLGRYITPAQAHAFIASNHLDRPVEVRYLDWVGNIVRGRFGTSYITHRPVSVDVGPRLTRTVVLTLVTLLVAVPLGVALGVRSARRWGTRQDMAMNIVAVVLSAFPEFVIGLLLLIIFAVNLKWLRVDSGQGLAFGTLAEQVKAYVLPALTLVIASVPFIMRNTRVAVREALAAPYIRAAVLHGVPRRRVVWHHAVRNAASPILNAVAINVIYLLAGVIVVENVFDFPGLGQDLVSAVGTGDTITVQAVAMLLGAIFIVVSVGTDVLAGALNPATRNTDQ